ncbi:hypothetical protein Tco_0158060 [Tanacetum coccineum]
MSNLHGINDVIKVMLFDVINYAALLWWDFMNCLFQKKDGIQYYRFTNLIIADFMKKYPSIPQIHDEDYHSIKDDIPLVSVYPTGNVLFRGMLIPDAFLTEEICAIDDYKEYETVFIGVEVPMNQPQPYVSTQGTHRTTPRAHRTPTFTATSPQGKKKKERDEIAEATILILTLHKTALAAEEQENVSKVQEKLVEEEIEKMVEGEEDEESYASTFADSMLNDDVDDSGTKIEPGSHKENLKVVNDVNVIRKKDDEKNDEDVEKMDDVAKEKNNDTTFSEELTTPVSPDTATTSMHKSKKGFTYNKTKILLGKHCWHMTFGKTNEMIKEELPCLINLAVNKDHEIDPINVPELISKEFATHGPK